MLYPTELRI